jgi:cytochrome c biogenesis DsbD-like protein/thioredoxin family protein
MRMIGFLQSKKASNRRDRCFRMIMMRMPLLLALLLSTQAFGAGKGDTVVKATMVADTLAVQPGKPFRVGIHLVMDPGWHTYWKDPGDAGLPTTIEWKLPEGFAAGEIGWPAPQQVIEPGNIKANAYSGETVLTTVITPPKTIKQKQIVISARVDWLVCEKVCIPGGADVSLTLPVGEAISANSLLFNHFTPGGDPIPVKHLSDKPPPPAVVLPGVQPSLFAVLFSAILGGLILNIMPCVLPVISLKIFNFVSEAHNDPKTIFKLGVVFALGILVSFWTLAAVVVALKQAGREIGWGFQLQDPIFVIVMSVVILVFGLSLFGVFEFYLPSSVSCEAGKLCERSGYQGAFFNGVLATALATPCTAPFLGTALGYAFSRSGLEIFTVFTAVAFGLALPYLLLTAKPGWLKHLPKPGPWMEKVKQFMGFLLIATLLWLLWIFGSQLGHKALVWLCAFLLMVSIGCWILGQFATPVSDARKKTIAWILALAVCLLGGFFFLPKALGKTGESAIAWVKFSPQELDHLISQRQTVFLDFTAEWCLTCKVNEHTVLETDEVRAALKEANAVTMKADWTRYDPEITQMLAKFNRSGVPLYVIYPGNDPENPIVLPEVITRGIVVKRLKDASKR